MSLGSSAHEYRGTDRFVIRRRVGAGGFGVVYEALDRERNATVALKVLRRHDAAVLYRFKQEFRTLADLAHPNLVQLFELHVDDDDWLFTMELVDGVNVLDYVRGSSTAESHESLLRRALSPLSSSGTPQSPTHSTRQLALADTGNLEAASLPSIDVPRTPFLADADRVRSAFRQLAEAVAALHEAGKLHRDIKPSNVLVDRDGRVVVLDFGLVTEATGEDQSVGGIAGTPQYMAPELGLLSGSGTPSDWYSVGVVLYEALAGRLPYDETALAMLFLQKQQRDPPLPSKFVTGVPEDLEELCMALLRRDPELRPSAADVLARLPAVETRPFRTRAARRSGPFVGRERHLSALGDAFRSVRGEGVTATALVPGRSGMGKSALLRRFLDDVRAREEESVLLVGRCYEQESVPYKALDSLVDALSRFLKRLPRGEAEALLPRDVAALARLFPVLEQVEAVRSAPMGRADTPDARELRRRGFSAFRELLARIGDRRPLVLVVDDLQWGDADSGALLADLLRPPDPPSLLFVAAYREDEVERSPCLRTLLPALRAMTSRSLRLHEVHVGSLADEEAAELARMLLGKRRATDDAERAAAIARESGGRPFYIAALTQYVDERDAEATRTSLTESQPSVSLDSVLHARVRRLPEPARRLLEVVAVAGQPVARSVASRAASLGPAEPTAVHALRSEQMIRTRSGGAAGEELESYHDRIRETVVAHLTPEARREHHQHLAEALEEAGGADAETLSVHYREAGDVLRAARYAVRAGEDAARALAFERAARLFETAIELESASGRVPDAEQLRGLREKLADVLASSGRGPDAAKAYLAAVEGADEARAIELRRRAAERLLTSGHLEEGLGLLRTVLDAVDLRFPDRPWKVLVGIVLMKLLAAVRRLWIRQRAEAEIPAATLLRVDTCWSVATGLAVVDTLTGSYFAARHLALALAVGEPYRIVQGLGVDIGFRSTLGGLKPSGAELRNRRLAESLLAKLRRPDGEALLHMNLGVAAVVRHTYATAQEHLETAETTLTERCSGKTWELDTTRLFLLVSHQWLGEWQELAGRLAAWVADAKERGDLYAETTFMTAVGHLPRLVSDDHDQALADMREALDAWSHRGFHVQHYYGMNAITEVLLYRDHGRGADALEALEGPYATCWRSMLRFVKSIRIESNLSLGRALVAAARVEGIDTARRAALLDRAERVARAIRREPIPGARLMSAVVHAGVASMRDDPDRRRESLEELVAAADSVRMHGYGTAARRRRGEIVGGAEGRAMIEAADAWMRERGVVDPARMTAMLIPGRFGATEG
ncbi:MAG: protein kinase [Deltaproteobacteria bacterium]|nr:protein kinase [Deltaproteobacteria bacterium]